MGIGGLFFISFFVHWLYIISVSLFWIYLLVTVVDILLLFSLKDGISAERVLHDRLSNGDENQITIRILNRYPLIIKTNIIDEIPFQFQKRDFSFQSIIKPGSERKIQYSLRPTQRGEYSFGKLNIYAKTFIGLAAKRYIFAENATLPVYPSFIQLRKYDLIAFSNHLSEFGIKRIRKIGHTMEFEHIREYVQGDDIRSINWKATSKRNGLMVNQYQDEKSQPVFQVIDIGRTMQMPFLGLSLLDYAINSTLALGNIVLKKQDKAGMFTFSKKVENYLPAEKRLSHIVKMMEMLYHIDTDFHESDFSRLYVDIKQLLKQRSVILLYTNFETLDGLRRQLIYLKNIAKYHLLIVVIFDNTELNKMVNFSAKNVQEVYDKVIAEKFSFEKRLIIRELERHGIQAILTQPENLTIDTINKYLELKAKGLI